MTDDTNGRQTERVQTYDNGYDRDKNERDWFSKILEKMDAFRELQRENVFLKERVSKLESKIQEMETEYISLQTKYDDISNKLSRMIAQLNRNQSEAQSGYQVKSAQYSQNVLPAKEKAHTVDETVIGTFSDLRLQIDELCSDFLFRQPDDLPEHIYNQGCAWIYRLMYTYIEKSGEEQPDHIKFLEFLRNCGEAGIKQMLKEGFEPQDYTEVRNVLNKAFKNYREIFAAESVNGYPRYSLIYADEGKFDSVNCDAQNRGKNVEGKDIDFCLFPGIKEFQYNPAENREVDDWRIKPRVCVSEDGI